MATGQQKRNPKKVRQPNMFLVLDTIDRFFAREEVARRITASLHRVVAGEYGEKTAQALEELLFTARSLAGMHRDVRSVAAGSARQESLRRRQEVLLNRLDRNERAFAKTLLGK